MIESESKEREMQRGKWRLVRGGKTRESQKRSAEGEVEASERRENESEKGDS